MDIFVFLDAVFCENTEPRSLQDKQKRAKRTFEEMMNYIPGVILRNSLISTPMRSQCIVIIEASIYSGFSF